MGLRDLYNSVEKLAAPRANDLTRSPEFARAVALVGGVNRAVRKRLNRATTRAWHTINLPTGTDLQRVKKQLGAMDRQIRLLTLELEKTKGDESRSEGVSDDGGSTGSGNDRQDPS